MPLGMHPDQVDVDVDRVRGLVAAQHPRWARLPVVEVASIGTVNAIYRLGDELCVRLPLQPSGQRSLAHELTWLPWLAPRLPVAVPEPVAVGEPDDGFPHRWAVYRWHDGATLVDAPLGAEGQATLADAVAEAVQAIGALPVDAATPAAERRRSLADIDPMVRVGLDHLDGLADVAATTAAWDEALAAERAAPPARPTWVHGDLLAANLLLRGARLAAVLDWGGAGLGDPACDLYPAWVLAPPARARFRAALDVDDAAWARGRGWALRTPITGLPYYRRTNPGFVAMSRAVLETVLAG